MCEREREVLQVEGVDSLQVLGLRERRLDHVHRKDFGLRRRAHVENVRRICVREHKRRVHIGMSGSIEWLKRANPRLQLLSS